MPKHLIRLIQFLLFPTIVGLSSCGLLKKNEPYLLKIEEPKSLFSEIEYEKDKDEILKLSLDSTSQFYFNLLLGKFLSESPSLTKDESVALLYGALLSEHYQDPKIETLELHIDSLKESGDIEGVLSKSSECLRLFPLNIKSMMETWLIYNRDSTNSFENIYGDRLSVLFKGMQTSGSFINENRPIIAHSKSAAEYYCEFHGAGAGLKYLDETKNENGDLIVRYSNSVWTEQFVIPAKE